MSEITTTHTPLTEDEQASVLEQILGGEPTQAPTVEEVALDLVTAAFPQGTETIGAYAIHKIVNGVFEVFGVERKIPPQMMYNYSRNGIIAKRAEKPNKDHQYTQDEVLTFVTKYTSKHAK